MERTSEAPVPTSSAGWGTPPWRVDAVPRPPAFPATLDAVVVGGGFTGLSAAYHLARAGAAVAVLEARRIGDGASGRTGGIVLEGTAAGPLEAVDRCVSGLAALVEREAIDCALRLDGCFEIAHGPRAARRVLGWRDRGAELDVVDDVEGGTVDPGALVSGLAAAAIRAGATLYERTPVTRLSVDPRPAIVLADGRVIRSARVVVALNAYAPTLPSVAGDTTGDADLPSSFTPALTYAICTEPVADGILAEIGLAAHRPFYTVDQPYLWGRTLADRRLVFGAGLGFDAARDVTRITLEQRDPAAALARLESRVRRLHPRLADVRIAARWGGPIAFVASRTPVLSRHPRSRDVIVAGGYAGHGVALGVRVGELAATALHRDAELPSWGAIAAR